MKILTVNALNVSYRVGHQPILALKNISFSVGFGEYLCVAGCNGTGKTTLVKAILGLVAPTSGSVHLACKKSRISYVPQKNVIPKDFPATAHELVLSGTQNPGFRLPFYTKSDRTLAKNMLEKVGLSPHSNRRISELSGGLQKRALIGRAMCKSPKLLILDEPCASLDEPAVIGIYRTLKEINERDGVTIIMISHDLKNVGKYATHVLELSGSMRFFGTVENWKTSRKAEGHP